MRINYINNYNYNFKTQNTNQFSFKGWSPETPENKEQIDKICNLLNTADIKRVSISGHSFPDSDSIGSSFAMAMLLNTKYKVPVDIFVFGNLPRKYKFLRGQPGIRVFSICDKNNNLIRRFGQYDLSISMDTPDNMRIHTDYYKNIFLKSKHRVKIDHHQTPTNNKKQIGNYAEYSLVDTKSPSASQLVMQFVEPLDVKKELLPKKFNEAIYTGILGDTGYLTRPNIDSAKQDAILLIKNGLKPKLVKAALHPEIPQEVNDFFKEALCHVKLSPKKRVVYLYIDDEIQKKINELNSQDMAYEINNKLKGFLTDTRRLTKANFSLIFQKVEENKLKVSARSEGINILDIAKKHHGGGHENAAGFCIPLRKNVDMQIKSIIKEFDDQY